MAKYGTVSFGGCCLKECFNTIICYASVTDKLPFCHSLPACSLENTLILRSDLLVERFHKFNEGVVAVPESGKVALLFYWNAGDKGLGRWFDLLRKPFGTMPEVSQPINGSDGSGVGAGVVRRDRLGWALFKL